MNSNTVARSLFAFGSMFFFFTLPDAGAQDTRSCELRGEVTSSGVKIDCEGFKSPHYLLDQNTVLSFKIYAEHPLEGTKIEIGEVSSLRGSLREYSRRVSDWDQELLNGGFILIDDTSAIMNDLVELYKKSEGRKTIGTRKTYSYIREVKIAASTPLYLDANTTQPVTVENEASLMAEAARAKETSRLANEKSRQATVESLRQRFSIPSSFSDREVEHIADVLTLMNEPQVRIFLSSTGEKLLMIKAGALVRYYEESAIDVILNYWKITRAQAAQGIIIRLENGVRTQ